MFIANSRPLGISLIQAKSLPSEKETSKLSIFKLVRDKERRIRLIGEKCSFGDPFFAASDIFDAKSIQVPLVSRDYKERALTQQSLDNDNR